MFACRETSTSKLQLQARTGNGLLRVAPKAVFTYTSWQVLVLLWEERIEMNLSFKCIEVWSYVLPYRSIGPLNLFSVLISHPKDISIPATLVTLCAAANVMAHSHPCMLTNTLQVALAVFSWRIGAATQTVPQNVLGQDASPKFLSNGSISVWMCLNVR